ncbi:MFS transporter [Paraburkholderia fynbosensis]|uniref:Niacin/nicotinamide transporter NaiP n=1 Tax=Paraburkholderia fynbosensis TaxID=1200993 RepID=A0A6J5H033_9BURK|nr:MFS transporter [Paraburkholderia fynbosensis]CAB3806646.1 Putative niacin/nicotinamide transporter NaiP [Paraburkholderia fynbosensis]
MSWFTSLSKNEKKAFAGAFVGHAVDVYDFMIYSFLIPVLMQTWHMSKATAGSIVTWTLVASLVGAIGAGLLADRYGRVRILRWTIALFALSCFACGFANSPTQLAVLRAVQGLGFGGESSLCMVLVTEMIRNPAHRGKFSGFTASSYSFGWAGAALAYSVLFNWLPPEWAWRVCLFVGILPALLVVWLRRNLREPESFHRTLAARRNTSAGEALRAVFSGRLAARTLWCSLLSGGMLGSYYAIATWMPMWLKSERGLSVTGTGVWLAVTIGGSLAGYALGAWATDRFGRRLTYILFAAGAFVMSIAYMLIDAPTPVMLLLGFLLGVLMQGTFSGVAATIAETYPNAIRATGYGVAYNVGRVIGSVFPFAAGWLANGHFTLTLAIPLVAGVGYCFVVLAALMLPETNGIALDAVEADAAATDAPAHSAPAGQAITSTGTSH